MKKSLKNIIAVVAFSAFCAIPAVSHAAVSLSTVSSEVSHHPSHAASIAGDAAHQSPAQAAEIAAAAMNGLGSHATPHNVAAIIRAVLPYLTNNNPEPCTQVTPVVLAGLQILSENGMLNARAVQEVLDSVDRVLPHTCALTVAQAVNDAYPQYATTTGGNVDDSGNVNTAGPILPATFLTGGGGGGGITPSVTPVKNR